MVKFFAYFILVILLYAVNTGFLQAFPFLGGLPDLLLMLVIFWSLEEKDANYALAAFGLGLLWDIAGGVFLGSFALGFLMVFLLLRAISQEVVALEYNRRFFPFVLLGAQLLVFVWAFVMSRIAAYFGLWHEVWGSQLLVRRFITEYFYNLVLFYPLWKLAEVPQILKQKFSPRIR